MPETGLYSLSIVATAEEGCALPVGEEVTLLVVVQAHSPQEAEDVALFALMKGRWQYVGVRTNEPVIVDPASHPGAIGEAMRHALKHGSAIAANPQ